MSKHQRLLSVDLLKSISVIFLIILHQFVWFLLIDDAGGLRYEGSEELLCGVFQSSIHILGMIPALAGVSLIMVLERKKMGLIPILKRSLFLAGLGYLLNLIVWGWEDFYDWDILQFTGLSMLISAVILRKLPGKTGIGVMAFLVIVCIAFADSFPYLEASGYYLYSIVIGDAAGESYWPLVPCFCMFGAGVLAGKVLALPMSRKALAGFFVSGLLLTVIPIGKGVFLPVCEASNLWGPAIFKPAPLFVLGMASFSFMLITGTELALRCFSGLRRLADFRFVRYYAHGILWIFIVFYLLGYHLTTLIIDSFELHTHNVVWIGLCLVVGELGLAYLMGWFTCRKYEVEYQVSDD